MGEKQFRWTVVLFLSALCAYLFFAQYYPALRAKYFEKESSAKPYVSIGGNKLYVDVADTEEKRQQGLSGRTNLPDNEGMLFLFSHAGMYTFWMKGMQFDLDFIFINGEKVSEVAEKVVYPRGGEQPYNVVSQKPFDAVLEVKAGTIAALNIHRGDTVTFSQQR